MAKARGIVGKEFQDSSQSLTLRYNDQELRDAISTVVSRDAFAIPTRTITTNESLDPRISVALCDTTNGTFTISLTYANYWGTNRTPAITLIHTAGAANVTIAAAAGNTINGAATFTLSPGDRIDLVSDGVSAWYVFASSVAPGLFVLRAGDTMTGALLMPDGTRALPAIAFSGDTNTGIHRSAADVLELVAGGAQRVQIGPTNRTYIIGNTEAFGLGVTYSPTSGSVYFGATDTTATPGFQISNAGGTNLLSGTNGGAITIPASLSVGTTLGVTGITTLQNKLLFSADNTHDIGALGATRPRDLWLGRNLVVGSDVSTGGAIGVGTTLTVGGVSNFANGSVAAPSITFSSDTNTGLYRNGADVLGIVAGGIERAVFYTRSVFIGSNEVYGLGVTYSSAGGSVFFGATDSTATPGFQISKASGSAWISGTNAGVVSVPSNTFQVYNSATNGDVTTARQFRIGQDSNTLYSFYSGYYFTGSQFAGVLQVLDNGSGSSLILNPSGGNVGVGTSPSYLLHTYSSTLDSQVGYFHLAKNNGGSGIGFSILDDRGFSGVNSGTTFDVATRNDGSNDTGYIGRFRTVAGDSTDFKIGIKKGFDITQSHGNTTAGGAGHYRFNSIVCTDTDMQSDPAGGTDGYFKTALRIEHYTAGTAGVPSGGINSLEVHQELNARTASDNPNRNYCAAFFSGYATVNDNGTALSPKGAVYGINPVGSLGASATYYHNVTAAEFNTNCVTGASVWYKTLIQLASQASDAVNGSDYDAMIGMGAATGSVGWKTGILFSNAHGQHPLASDGYILRTMGSSTIGNGIDISSYTVSTNAWKSTGCLITGGGRLEIDASFSANNAMYVRNSANSAGQAAALFKSERANADGYVIVCQQGSNNQFIVSGDATNAVQILVNGSLKTIEVGASDSGGTGYRMLRVTN